jgi:hypothetical protein
MTSRPETCAWKWTLVSTPVSAYVGQVGALCMKRFITVSVTDHVKVNCLDPRPSGGKKVCEFGKGVDAPI